MQEIIELCVFILFIAVFFKILMAIRLERLFKQGAVLEIRLAYFLFSIVLAEIATCAFARTFMFFYTEI